MGYFPNGTAGDIYEAEHCERCVHYAGEEDNKELTGDMCPVLFLHFLWNYQQSRGDRHMKDALELFIPRKDGFNEQCKMFYED